MPASAVGDGFSGVARLLASVVLLAALPPGDRRWASGEIIRHEVVDGELRESVCEGLHDCVARGMSTPAMLLLRSWALEMEDLLRERGAKLEALNASAWLARKWSVRTLLRRRLLKASSPRGPPPVRLVRRFGDAARGVEVSQLVFEAWPGQAVPGVIFSPLPADRPQGGAQRLLPAVLHIPGHLSASFRDPAEQRLILNLVHRGYVVLTFDTLSQGERQQYRGTRGAECSMSCRDDGQFRAHGPPCTAAHDHFGKQLWLLGQSAAEIFLGDAQVALDLLASLPGVDPHRLGVVGCSGGGMLTAYLAAVDERVTAACIACYFSSLAKELEVGFCNYDAEQIIWKQVRYGIDKADLLAARAPEATLLLLTSHDCFPVEGGREGWAEAAAAFAAHGRTGDRLGLYADVAVGYHGFTDQGLEATYRFFDENLGAAHGEAHSVQHRGYESTPLPCQQLRFGREQVARGAWSIGRPSYIQDRVLALARPVLRRLRGRRRVGVHAASPWRRSLRLLSADAAGMNTSIVEDLLAKIAGGASQRPLHGQAAPLASRRAPLPLESREEWYAVATEGVCSVTLRAFRGNASAPASADLVALIFGGAALIDRELSSLEAETVSALLARGVARVLIVGLCGYGDELWHGGLLAHAPLLLGRTHVGFHATEVLHAIAWAVVVLGARRVILVGLSSAGAAVLHAAQHLLPPPQPRLQRGAAPVLAGVAIMDSVCCLADVASSVRHRLPWQMQMHGVLRHYDLPDLLANLARRGGPACLVARPLGARGHLLPQQRARAAYGFADKCFAEVGQRLRMLSGKHSDAALVKAVSSLARAAARPG